MSAQPQAPNPRLRAWRAHHLHCAKDSWRRIASTPVQSLVTAAALAIALMLPAALWVAIHNLALVGERWDASPKLTLYLKTEPNPTALAALQEQIRQAPGVAGVTYVSPDEALAQMQQQAGLAESLQGLDHNPLPGAILVTPLLDGENLAALTPLAERLRQDPLVDQVALDTLWVSRLQQWLALGRQFTLALGSLFALGALIVVGNTVRLAIESRRDEIRVMKLVGGTHGFIRRPFLYTGACYGLLGGLLASISLALGFSWLNGAAGALAQSYQTEFLLAGLGLGGSLALILIACLLGLMGAALAVARHLRDIEP